MRYTNEHQLPESICAMLRSDDYDGEPNAISVTALLAPARAWALKRRHAAEIAIDYSDLLAIGFGNALHAALARVPVTGAGDFREKRFQAKRLGFTVTGKPDAFLGGVLRDAKTTSVWKYAAGDFGDYVKQLSIYRWLLAENGIEAEPFGCVDFFFTDWSRKEARRGGNYPPIRYAERRLELLTLEETEKLVFGRLEEFAFARGCLPRCTAAELWQPATVYAYYAKPGAARATRIYETREAAEGKSGVIVERAGKAKRCAYCAAAPFCEQYKELKEMGLVEE